MSRFHTYHRHLDGWVMWRHILGRVGGVGGGRRNEGGGCAYLLTGGWGGRMSCTGSLLQSGRIPNGDGVLKQRGASAGGGLGEWDNPGKGMGWGQSLRFGDQIGFRKSGAKQELLTHLFLQIPQRIKCNL